VGLEPTTYGLTERPPAYADIRGRMPTVAFSLLTSHLSSANVRRRMSPSTRGCGQTVAKRGGMRTEPEALEGRESSRALLGGRASGNSSQGAPQGPEPAATAAIHHKTREGKAQPTMGTASSLDSCRALPHV
jgi:hypothetical protein